MSDFRGLAKILEPDFTVVSLDNRGAGETASDLDFTLHDMANDVVNLWSELNITKSSILGISMGGVIAQLVAKNVEQMIEKMVLISSTPRMGDIRSDLKPWTAEQTAIEEKLSRNFSEDFLNRNKLLLRAMAKNILHAIQNTDFVDRAAAQRKAMTEASPDSLNFHSSVETLVIHGSHDEIIPFSVTAEYTKKFSKLRIKTFESRGHLLIAESPAELYQEVRNFLLQ